MKEKLQQFEDLKKKVLEILVPKGTKVEYIKEGCLFVDKYKPLSVTLLRDIICYNYLHLLDEIDTITKKDIDDTVKSIFNNHIFKK
jgi:hypothetical protein